MMCRNAIDLHEFIKLINTSGRKDATLSLNCLRIELGISLERLIVYVQVVLGGFFKMGNLLGVRKTHVI